MLDTGVPLHDVVDAQPYPCINCFATSVAPSEVMINFFEGVLHLKPVAQLQLQRVVALFSFRLVSSRLLSTVVFQVKIVTTLNLSPSCLRRGG